MFRILRPRTALELREARDRAEVPGALLVITVLGAVVMMATAAMLWLYMQEQRGNELAHRAWERGETERREVFQREQRSQWEVVEAWTMALQPTARQMDARLDWWNRHKDRGAIVAVEKEALELLMEAIDDAEQSEKRHPLPARR